MHRVREVKIEGSICIVPLTQGKMAICDSVDYDIVAGHNWYTVKGPRTFYAGTTIGKTYRTEYLHRMIFGLQDRSIEVDHINGDGSNNCRVNLRLCNKSENKRNVLVVRGSSSGYKGVSWNTEKGKWVARICVYKKESFLGYFNNKEEAAQAYNEASVKYHGDFGKRNELEKTCA